MSTYIPVDLGPFEIPLACQFEQALAFGFYMIHVEQEWAAIGHDPADSSSASMNRMERFNCPIIIGSNS